MKFKGLLLISLGIAVSLVSSCKKDEEEEPLESLITSFKINLPAFAQPGQVVTIDTKDILKMAKTKDGSEVGFYWKLSPLREFNDTIKTTSSPDFTCDKIEIYYADTLCEQVFTLTAFAKDYYSSSASAKSEVVDAHRPSASLTYNDDTETTNFPEKNDGAFTDPRDGKVYVTRVIGNKEWFKENLSWEGSGLAYMGCDVMNNIFGRYYTWEEAKASCPEGWRLSTEEDWVDMAKNVKDGEFSSFAPLKGVAGRVQSKTWFNKKALWEYWPRVDLKENSFLGIVNTGYVEYGDLENKFVGVGNYAAYWTADESDAKTAFCRYIFEQDNDILVGARDKKYFGAAVRCVRDVPSADQ